MSCRLGGIVLATFVGWGLLPLPEACADDTSANASVPVASAESGPLSVQGTLRDALDAYLRYDLGSADSLATHVLDYSERVFGEESLEAASAMATLLDIRAAQGRSAEDATLELARRAVAIRETRLSPNNASVAEILAVLGEILKVRGETEEARQVLQRVIDIRRSRTARAWDAMADLHSGAWELEEARVLYEREIETLQSIHGEQSGRLIRPLVLLGRVLLRSGRHGESERVYLRALSIVEETGVDPYPSAYYVQLGLAELYCFKTNDLLASKAAARAALDIARSAGTRAGSRSASAALGSLALAHAAIGEFADAELAYLEAIDLYSKDGATRDVAATQANLADLLRETGDLERALRLYRDALRRLEESFGPDHFVLAFRHRDLANALLLDGQVEEAQAHFETALAITEATHGRDHPITAQQIDAFGRCRGVTGRLDEASVLCREALHTVETALGKDAIETARPLANLAEIEARLGRVDEAIVLALKAEDLSLEHFRTIARGGSEGEALAFAEERVRGLDTALRWLPKAETSAVTRCWDATIQARALVENEMAWRWRMVNESPANATVSKARQRYVEASRALSQLLVRGPEENSSYLNEVAEARRVRHEAEKALAHLDGVFEGLDLARRDLADVLQALPQNSALVAFAAVRCDPYWTQSAEGASIGEDLQGRYGAFVARNEGTPSFVSLGSMSEIDAAVSRWSHEIADGYQGAEDDYRDAGREVRALVWDPIAPLVEGVGRVFVVLDGALHRLTFAALPREAEGYLIEDRQAFHYLTAERDLLDPEVSHRGEGVLLVGGLDYGSRVPEDVSSDRESIRPLVAVRPVSTELGLPVVSRGAGGPCADFESVTFEPLPGTTIELDRIVDLFHGDTSGQAPPGSQVEIAELRGADADELSLRRLVKGKRVVHFATHGFFLGNECPPEGSGTRGIGGLSPRQDETPSRTHTRLRHPLRLCGLALSSANARDQGARGSDGVLTAEEIAAFDLKGLEWAVLSACDTGSGDVQISEGVLGLRRAFRIAGASTVIMSLWPVTDEGTLEWMESLYSSRLRGLDTAASVQSATISQLEARRRSGLDTHPFYWAGFVAAGQWR